MSKIEVCFVSWEVIFFFFKFKFWIFEVCLESTWNLFWSKQTSYSSFFLICWVNFGLSEADMLLLLFLFFVLSFPVLWWRRVLAPGNGGLFSFLVANFNSQVCVCKIHQFGLIKDQMWVSSDFVCFFFQLLWMKNVFFYLLFLFMIEVFIWCYVFICPICFEKQIKFGLMKAKI